MAFLALNVSPGGPQVVMTRKAAFLREMLGAGHSLLGTVVV